MELELGGPAGHELTLLAMDGQPAWWCSCQTAEYHFASREAAVERWQWHVKQATGVEPPLPVLPALPD